MSNRKTPLYVFVAGLALLALLLGCACETRASAPPPPVLMGYEDMGNYISRYQDRELGVACYVMGGYRLSCVKVK